MEINKLNESKLKAKELAQKSIIENIIKKETAMREKEVIAHKKQSLYKSTIIGLFVWLCIALIVKNILLAGALALVLASVCFGFLLYLPIMKAKNYSKKIESDLPDFLTKVIYELRAKKSFLRAISDASKENGYAAKEFSKVIQELEKGASFAESLERMNNRSSSINIKRANSNLHNIWMHGANNSDGLKRLTKELFLKQRIESKEFSSKMVVYSLVFIAISAIVPAMFQSFILIGSYFMKITLSSIEVLAIIILLFPLIDICILSILNSKTPLFLRDR